MAADLTEKVQRAVLEIRDKVNKIAEMTYDANLKLHHVLETRFQYRSLPAGIDYDEYEV